MIDSMKRSTVSRVALRKESVDRNSTYVIRLPRCQVSLSARRAWIEIDAIAVQAVNSSVVALRKESVDRNGKLRNPSRPGKVALRKESVDRNGKLRNPSRPGKSRSPQGERG